MYKFIQNLVLASVSGTAIEMRASVLLLARAVPFSVALYIGFLNMILFEGLHC